MCLISPCPTCEVFVGPFGIWLVSRIDEPSPNLVGALQCLTECCMVSMGVVVDLRYMCVCIDIHIYIYIYIYTNAHTCIPTSAWIRGGLQQSGFLKQGPIDTTDQQTFSLHCKT